MTEPEFTADHAAAIERLNPAREKILQQLAQVIVGQGQVIEELLISLFSRGHCLLEGVPGLAKTLLISTLSRTLNLSFSRIQFTPDLMPDRHYRHGDHRREPQHRGPRIPLPRRARCFPT